jgi:hypothetical protein
MNWTPEEYEKWKQGEFVKKVEAKNKYHAVPVREDGKFFASTAEYRRWRELDDLFKMGAIQDLIFQPIFFLTKARIKYRADYQYKLNGQIIVEDQKGARTPRFNLLMKLWAYYGPHTIRITKKKGDSYGYVSEEIIPGQKKTKKSKRLLDKQS